MMHLVRSLVLFLALSSPYATALGQDCPSRPITTIVPFLCRWSR